MGRDEVARTFSALCIEEAPSHSSFAMGGMLLVRHTSFDPVQTSPQPALRGAMFVLRIASVGVQSIRYGPPSLFCFVENLLARRRGLRSTSFLRSRSKRQRSKSPLKIASHVWPQQECSLLLLLFICKLWERRGTFQRDVHTPRHHQHLILPRGSAFFFHHG